MCARAAMMALTLSPVLVLTAQQRAPFSPARILTVDLPAPPPPTIIGGGEVLVEAIIDRHGTLTRPVLLRSTPPYAQMVLDAVTRWRFQPARGPRADGVLEPVDAPVLIAAVYRP